MTQPGGWFLNHAEADVGNVFTPEQFSDRDLAIGEVADRFLRSDVLPHVARIEAGDHVLMHDLIRKAGRAGLLAADIPTAYGGLGLSAQTAALISEKLNWQQSFALTHEAHTVIGTLPLMYFGSDTQKRRYLPLLANGGMIAAFALSEPNAGTDVLGMRTRARRVPGGGYVIDGAKQWITNSAFASLFTVFARDEDGRITAYLVERDSPGLSFGPEENKLGMRGTSTRRLVMDSVRVPAENAIAVGNGHYAAFCALNLGRFKLEAGAVGGLKETLAICTRYAQERRAFGKPLSSKKLVAMKLADMAGHIFALESMVYRLSGDLNSVFATIQPDAIDAPEQYHRAAEEYVVECSIVKVIGSELYSRLTDEAIQIHGGYGYSEDFAPARSWRDQRLLRIGEGANEVVRMAIIRQLLKRAGMGRLDFAAIGGKFAYKLADSPHDNWAAAWCNWTKRVALWLLGNLRDEFGDGLDEAQDVAAVVADLIGRVYAVDSCLARRRVRPLGDSATAACDAAVHDYTVAALNHAIAACATMESTRQYLPQLASALAQYLGQTGSYCGDLPGLEDSPPLPEDGSGAHARRIEDHI